MSMIGRLAKAFGATALTGNLGAGVVAASTDSFSLGTMFGVSDNLFNPSGMGYGMEYNYPGSFSGFPGSYPNTFPNFPGGMSDFDNYSRTNGCFSIEPMSPFGYGMSDPFSSNSFGCDMWTNPAILW